MRNNVIIRETTTVSTIQGGVIAPKIIRQLAVHAPYVKGYCYDLYTQMMRLVVTGASQEAICQLKELVNKCDSLPDEVKNKLNQIICKEV